MRTFTAKSGVTIIHLNKVEFNVCMQTLLIKHVSDSKCLINKSSNIPQIYKKIITLQVNMLFFFLRATVIMAYLPEELLGSSVYEYIHEDDIANLAKCHRQGIHLTERKTLLTVPARIYIQDCCPCTVSILSHAWQSDLLWWNYRALLPFLREQNGAVGENSTINLNCGQFMHACPCPPMSLSAVSAAAEREDQYRLLQAENKRWLIHHTTKPLVQFH